MKNKSYIIFIITSILVFVTPLANAQDFYTENAFKLRSIFYWIDKYYVDSVSTEEMTEEMIVDLLYKLDPHSSYISTKDVKKMNEPLQGNFEGIGISFNILQDTLFVVSPIVGGPSEKVGILAGDRIVMVDGKNIAGIGITNNDVFDMLRGKKGTKVSVTILRRNEKGLLEFEIIRDKIPIYSIDASYKVNDDIGYIKLSRFSMTTMSEFRDAITRLKEDGIKSLILDLTGNGGGYLEVASELADEFLPNDRLIVYTEGSKSPKREYIATQNGSFESGNLVIMIDEGSASASEIVSGAIQDWDRGIIIGRRSFGKGLVQKPFILPDQSEIRLTVARYYTPTGRLIQKPYDNEADYELDILNRYNHGELISKDSIHFPDSLKYQTLNKKRTVYGGGGIMPDYFIPIDTTYYSDFYKEILRKGILNQFILTYIDENRELLKQQFPDFTDFQKNYTIRDDLFQKLIKDAESQGITNFNMNNNLSNNEVRLLMKAYVARDLWTSNEFYQVINQDDTKFLKAVEILENWPRFQAMTDSKK